METHSITQKFCGAICIFFYVSHFVRGTLSYFDAWRASELAHLSINTSSHMNGKELAFLAVGKVCVMVRLCFILSYSILDKTVEFWAVCHSRRLLYFLRQVLPL